MSVLQLAVVVLCAGVCLYALREVRTFWNYSHIAGACIVAMMTTLAVVMYGPSAIYQKLLGIVGIRLYEDPRPVSSKILPLPEDKSH